MGIIRKDQFSLVSTNTLPTRVSDTIIAATIERKQHIAKLRDLGFVDNSPDEGAVTYPYEVLDALTDATDIAEGSSPGYDDANASETSGTILKLMKAFKLTYEADHLKKINLRVGQTKACVDKVMAREDSKICTSLISSAGNTYAGTDWSAGTADPIYDIRHGKRLNRDDGYMSDYILLNPTNNEELDSIIASNDWYSITEQTVKTGDGGKIVDMNRKEAIEQTLGTATIFTSGVSGSFFVAEAVPLRINIFDDQDCQVTKVQVFERVFSAAVVRTLSDCTLTGL